jgi:hypothetical protein
MNNAGEQCDTVHIGQQVYWIRYTYMKKGTRKQKTKLKNEEEEGDKGKFKKEGKNVCEEYQIVG